MCLWLIEYRGYGIKYYIIIILFSALASSHGYCSFYDAEDIIVSCDRWPDCSSLERFGNDCVRLAGADTHEEKAIAVWRFIQQCTKEGLVPKEPAYGRKYILSPLKLLNVYGVHWCDGLSRIMTMTWRDLGYRAEKLYYFGHTLADCRWEDDDGIDRWHVFDLSQHWYVYDRTGSHIATKEELALDHSLIYFPSRTPIPSRPSLVQPSFVHAGHLKMEHHNAGISLRSKESIERYWGNEGKPYYNLFGKKSRKDFEHGPYPITYGNGRFIYEPNLGEKNFEEGLFREPVNLACTEIDGLSPALHPEDSNKKAIAVFKIALPYIISDAWLNAKLIRKNINDKIKFFLSVDEGRTWHTFWQTGKELGPIQLDQINFCRPFNPSQKMKPKNITPFGRYDYLIKIEMKSAKKITDCGLDSLSVVTVLQHNLFSLPMLRQGKNLITVRGKLAPQSTLRITYLWDDGDGKARNHVVDIITTPYQYEITTKGKKWDEVICRSIKIEALKGMVGSKAISLQEKVLVSSPRPGESVAFPTEKSIGRYFPKPMKDISYYISKLEEQLNIQNDPATDDEKLKHLSRKLSHNIMALSSIKDPKSKDVLEKVIENDRSYSYKNKVWACQALFHSVGQSAVPMMIRILEKDEAIVWHDPKKRCSKDTMWLHTASMAAAILARIKMFEGREVAADLIAAILAGHKTKIDPRKLWYGEEICWGLIRSLGKLGNQKQISLLLKNFSGKDSDTTAVTILALKDIGSSSIIPHLLRLLKRFEYSPVGLYAIEALGDLGNDGLGKHLYPFLHYWDEDFRGAAAKSLGRMGDYNAIPELKEMMDRERFPWVISEARKSLQKLEGLRMPSGENFLK